jgi:hypothetical protein
MVFADEYLRRDSHSSAIMRKPLRYSFASGFLWIGVASLIAYAASPIHTAPLDVARTFAGGRTLLGLTYTGFVVALFPLSYFNHVLIGKAYDQAAGAGGSIPDDLR